MAPVRTSFTERVLPDLDAMPLSQVTEPAIKFQSVLRRSWKSLSDRERLSRRSRSRALRRFFGNGSLRSTKQSDRSVYWYARSRRSASSGSRGLSSLITRTIAPLRLDPEARQSFDL